jgi:hypothetical protein
MLTSLIRSLRMRLNDAPESGVPRAVRAETRFCEAALVHGARACKTGQKIGTFSSGWLLLFFATALSAALYGCASGNNVKASAISVIDPSGSTSEQVTFLGAGSTVQVNMTPVGDTANAGVNWTVTCGGSPVTGSISNGACGTFVPTHTPNGVASMYTAPSIIPIGNTVTLTAAVAGNPSASSSVTLPVVAASKVLSFISPVPSSIALGEQVLFNVRLLNGTGADSIQWTATCGSSSCGSFTNDEANGEQEYYIAPASMPASGNTIQITATLKGDSTVTASTTLAIPSSLISITPTTDTLPIGSKASFSVTLASSITTGGADLTVSCNSSGSCGSFSGSTTAHMSSGTTVTYTAPAAIPSGGAVTITAKSTSQPTQSATAVVTIAPAPTIAFSKGPPSSLTAGTQAQVSAAVTNDISSAGVTWTLKCNSTMVGGCGSILPYQTASGQTATYTAPPVTTSGTTVTIIATSTAASNAGIASNASISSSIAIVPATALSIAFVSPAPSQMQPGATVNVNAAVSNDSKNEGVDWQLCASGCGYFIVKPATPAIPATTTTPFQPSVPAVTAISVQAWPNGLPLPYTAPVTPPSGDAVTMTATAHADQNTTTQASVTITSAGTGPALNGIVTAGAQPVAGTVVQLFEAGTSGYGSKATALTSPNSTSTVVTDSNGNFTIPAGYSCTTTTSQVYVVAIGGSVGANQPNTDLAMMTALGPCGNLNSQIFLVNEVTTVASVWPLAPFASNDPLTGKSSYQYLGASSTNTAGLIDAFATVNNLVDISTGQARFVVPAGNATVPYVEINSMADILNACTSTSGGSEGDGSACGDLLADTDPLSYNSLYYSTPPKDTLQAAFNIAQHPASRGGLGYNINVSVFFDINLISLASPFQPIVAKDTNSNYDWSISLNFTGGGLSSSSVAKYFAIDASDNLWITDSNAGTVVEWNNQGVALSPSAGFPAGGGPMAIDTSGNIWISGNNTLTELTNLGAAYPWSPYKGIAGGGADMTFDAGGNLWIGDGGGVAEFTDLGVELSPEDGYVNSGVTSIGPVAIDSSNNVWAGGTSLAELSQTSGQLIISTTVHLNGSVQIAADGSGRVWIPDPRGGNGLCVVQPANTVQLYKASCYDGWSSNGGSSKIGTIYDPQGVAVDGEGYVWIASAGGTNINGSGYSAAPNLTEIDPSDPYDYYAGYQASSLSNGTERAAVDRAGNVWVLLANNTVTKYVGVATPAVTPIALGIKNKKLGAKP